MKNTKFDIIIIGGSAGSLEVIAFLLKALPKPFDTPVVLVIHRMKNTTSKLDKMLVKQTGVRNILEPEDKEPLNTGMVYLAPQNYHLMMEADSTFSLDYSEHVNFSRPSIDISFESFAKVFGNRTLAILLSGANKDGAEGLRKVIELGGTAVIQSPLTAAYPTMPNAAINLNPAAFAEKPEQIVNRILHDSK